MRPARLPEIAGDLYSGPALLKLEGAGSVVQPVVRPFSRDAGCDLTISKVPGQLFKPYPQDQFGTSAGPSPLPLNQLQTLEKSANVHHRSSAVRGQRPHNVMQLLPGINGIVVQVAAGCPVLAPPGQAVRVISSILYLPYPQEGSIDECSRDSSARLGEIASY